MRFGTFFAAAALAVMLAAAFTALPGIQEVTDDTTLSAVPAAEYTFTITQNGTIFSAVGTPGAITISSGSIQDVINAIDSGRETAIKKLIFGTGTAIDLGTNAATLQKGTYVIEGSVTSSSAAGTILLSGGASVHVTTAIVATTATSGMAIFNNSAGSINISGGTVTAKTGYATYNNSSGSINISGGTVSTETGYATYNNSSDAVINISGGTVTAKTGWAAYNNATGTINISGGTVTAGTAGLTNGWAAYNNAAGTINISGGTVTGEGSAVIQNPSGGTVSISGGTVTAKKADGTTIKSTGTVNISGGTIQALGANGRAIQQGEGIVKITGGSVKATGTGYAVYAGSTGAAGADVIYLKGTVVGELYFLSGMILEVDRLDIPISYHDTSNGVIVKKGTPGEIRWSVTDASGEPLDRPILKVGTAEFAWGTVASGGGDGMNTTLIIIVAVAAIAAIAGAVYWFVLRKR